MSIGHVRWTEIEDLFNEAGPFLPETGGILPLLLRNLRAVEHLEGADSRLLDLDLDNLVEGIRRIMVLRREGVDTPGLKKACLSVLASVTLAQPFSLSVPPATNAEAVCQKQTERFKAEPEFMSECLKAEKAAESAVAGLWDQSSFETRYYCLGMNQNITATLGPDTASARVLQSCLQSENEAYATIKAQWENSGDDVAAICSAFLDQKAFSSYLLLSTCLKK